MDVGGTLWCTDCGAEHRLGAPECAFCGGALASAPPEQVPPVEVSREVDHLDVSDLGRQQRDALALLLRAEDIPHVFERHLLRVPAARVETARAMLADVLEPIDPTSPAAAAFEDEAAAASHDEPSGDGELRFASTTSRVVCRVLASVAVSLVASIFLWGWSYVAPDVGPGVVPVNELLILAELALVARVGWDVGKLAGGMRVVDAEGAAPGWRRSAIRSLVMWGPYYLLLVLAWSIVDSDEVAFSVLWVLWVLQLAWPLTLIASIARHPERRGWHDRAAGTWVVEAREPGVAARSVRRMTTRTSSSAAQNGAAG